MTVLLRPFLFALLVLAACQTPAPQAVTPGTSAVSATSTAQATLGLATAAIETTKLDAAPLGPAVPAKPAAAAGSPATGAVTVQVPGPSTPRPKARPAALTPAAKVVKPQQTEAPIVPDLPKLPEQVACEKSKGTWATVGDSGPNFCQHRTRDAGKQCSQKSQCQGECLARSGTCSPVTPLFGCNDVLDNEGRTMTNCLQ